MEAATKGTALALTQEALKHSEDKYDLLEDRYRALERTKKQARVRSIMTGIGTAVGMFAIGYGVGVVTGIK